VHQNVDPLPENFLCIGIVLFVFVENDLVTLLIKELVVSFVLSHRLIIVRLRR